MDPNPHGPSFFQVPLVEQLLKNHLIFQASENRSIHRHILQKKPLITISDFLIVYML